MISLLSNYWTKMNGKWASTHVRRHMFHWVHTVTEVSRNANCLWLLPQNLYNLSVTASVLINVLNSLSEFPFWEGKQWERRKVVQKNMVRGRVSSCKAKEPKGSGVWAELVWQLFPPTEICPQEISSLGWGGKTAGSDGPLKATESFARTYSTRLFVFSSVWTGPCSSIFPRRVGMNYRAHVLLLQGTGTLHRNQGNLLSLFLRYSDARRCDIKAALHNQQKKWVLHN